MRAIEPRGSEDIPVRNNLVGRVPILVVGSDADFEGPSVLTTSNMAILALVHFTRELWQIIGPFVHQW